jgi:ribonuclease P protein component
MLASKERFSRSEFTTFLSNKDFLVVYNQLGTLKYLKTTPQKLSVVTGSKHQKKAVLRNKLRRRIYTLFRGTINIQGILYTSKTASVLEYDDIVRLFHELLVKAQKNTK